ncbi:MAG: glucose-1-phosphate adenylyltransferase [Anaerolineales bacterium]|nr:glucose-1-phosphate adenylyltransferase [Anaerolineales bacterium]
MPYQDVVGVVLGGGRGARLWPLTKMRAKPAVPIGGKYRLVDVPISNCLNSGIDRIAIMTQFNSVSLHRHIAQTYNFDVFHQGWVEILAAEQTLTSADWYQGTADAVRKQLFEIRVTGAKDILILAGDHLYRMDYAPLIEQHRQTGADVTVAVKPISAEDAGRFGVLRMGDDGRITDFVEKPQSPDVLQRFVSRSDPAQPYVGSMGIYLFRSEILSELLESHHADFGEDLLPASIQTYRVFGYTFRGYWEDIGTMRAFYEANLMLTRPNPPFSFDDPIRPIYTHPRFLPGSRIYDVRLDQVLLADGCVVQGAEIRNTVIGLRSVIGDDVVITNSILMGADFYEESGQYSGRPAMGLANGCRIEGAIIDKNACIGKGVRIGPFPRGTELDGERWSVRDGIVVVPKQAVIPDGTVIAPS